MIETLIHFVDSERRTHTLPIGTDRLQNIAILVTLEFHYIFSCSKLDDNRNLFLRQKFKNRTNSLKFSSLMNSNNLSDYQTDMNNLCKFIRIVNERLKSPV